MLENLIIQEKVKKLILNYILKETIAIRKEFVEEILERILTFLQELHMNKLYIQTSQHK